MKQCVDYYYVVRANLFKKPMKEYLEPRNIYPYIYGNYMRDVAVCNSGKRIDYLKNESETIGCRKKY